jgi:hypothetical protein
VGGAALSWWYWRTAASMPWDAMVAESACPIDVRLS